MYIFISAFLNSLTRDQQNSINFDLAGLAEGSRPKYTRYGFMQFLKYANEHDLPVSAEGMKAWSQHLQDQKMAVNKVKHAWSMFIIIASAFGFKLRSGDSLLINHRIKFHNRAFQSRPEAKLRYPISREDIISILNKPPQYCPVTTWQYFVTLAWVFLMRRKEVLQAKPEDLRFRKTSSGKQGFEIRITNNKNNINKREPKWVFFETKEIPRQLIPILHALTHEIAPLWKNLPKPELIISHLRKIITFDESTYELVIHCFRHGRPKDLIINSDYSSTKIARKGCWDSLASVKRYAHV